MGKLPGDSEGCAETSVRVLKRICNHVYKYMDIYIYMIIQIYIYIYTCIDMYICVYIYIYIHRKRERNRIIQNFVSSGRMFEIHSLRIQAYFELVALLEL